MTDKSFTPAAPVADLPAGSKKVVEINGQSILLCHSKDKIFAVLNLCSHADEKLDCGKMKNGWIACPIHGARFDLETGAPMNPPASEPIKTFETRINGDMIEVAA